MEHILISLNDAMLKFMDVVLGWSLHISMDAALIVVAVGTSAALTFVRLWTTDQKLLKRCQTDKKTLKKHMKAAKRSGDRDAVRRYRATLSMIAMHTMKAEFKPLLASLIPIILLATWAFARLSYVPFQPGEPITVQASFEPIATGRLAHVVPMEGMTAADGWITRIARPETSDSREAVPTAQWVLSGSQQGKPYEVTIRYAQVSAAMPVIVDGMRYANPDAIAGDAAGISRVHIVMQPYRLFGIVPGIPLIKLPPWLTAYFLIAIPFVFIIRRVFRIA